jgi:hypothetical protein
MDQQQPVFKTITVLFMAFLIGQVMFAAIAYFLVSAGSIGDALPQLVDIFTILVPVLIVGGWLVGKFMYDKKMQAAQVSMAATEKLEIYRAAFIMRCALLEAPVLFAIIAYLLAGKDLLLLFAVGGIVLFSLQRPTKVKVARELQLSEAEL